MNTTQKLIFSITDSFSKHDQIVSCGFSHIYRRNCRWTRKNVNRQLCLNKKTLKHLRLHFRLYLHQKATIKVQKNLKTTISCKKLDQKESLPGFGDLCKQDCFFMIVNKHFGNFTDK